MAETTAPPRTDSAQAGGVDARLERLRALAAEDPAAAREDAWAWITECGRRLRSDRDAARAELDAMFAAGRPPEGIDGPTEGQLVGFTVHPAVDRTLAGITAAWLPWAGKSFDAGSNRGENLLLRSARLPARLPWPRYSMRDAGERIAAFDFNTYVEPSALDPRTEVLVIDYASVEDNPAVIIKSIRDELVELVAGANLGRMLWRQGDAHHMAAFFALKSRLG